MILLGKADGHGKRSHLEHVCRSRNRPRKIRLAWARGLIIEACILGVKLLGGLAIEKGDDARKWAMKDFELVSETGKN